MPPHGAGAADESPMTFVTRLRSALAAGDRRGAAAMFRYPLRVNEPALPLPIPLDNTASTLQMYDLLFTPEMRCAIDLAQSAQDASRCRSIRSWPTAPRSPSGRD